MLLILNICL